MITAFPLSQGNMLGFTIDGEVDDEGMRRLLLALEAKVAAHGQVRLLGNVKKIGSFESFQSFGKLLRAKSDLWDKVEKYAILTDYGWLSSLTDGIDWLTPRMEVKTFALSEGELAHQWLKLEPAREAHLGEIQEIDLGRPDLFGIAISGDMATIDYGQLDRFLAERISPANRNKVLIDLSRLQGLTIRSFGEFAKVAFRRIDNAERVAILTDIRYLKFGAKLTSLISSNDELVIFKPHELERAKGWLG